MAIAPDSARCPGTNRDGGPCRSTVLLASGWCPAHDPDQRGRLRVLGQKGGHAKSTAARAAKLVPSVLKPVLQQLLDAMPKVEDGTLLPQQATALASLASAAVKIYQSAELEERLQALEQAAQPGGRGA